MFQVCTKTSALQWNNLFLAVLALLTLCEHWAAAEPQVQNSFCCHIWAFYSVADWKTWTRTGKQNVQQQQWKWIYTTFYFRVTWEWRQPGGRDSKHLYSSRNNQHTNSVFPCFTSSLIPVQWLFSSPVNHVSYLGCDNAKTIHVHQTKKELSIYCQIHHHLSHPWRKNVGRRKKMPVWRTEEVRITREREGEERGRKHAHALLCKGEKPQRTDITACGPLSRIEMPPPHRWRQSEFFTPSQSTAHVIV